VLDPGVACVAHRSSDHDESVVTKRSSARLAGIAYLLYIAFAFPAMMISARSTRGADIAARVASFAQHAADVRLGIVLELLGCFCALVLAVTLWSLTRDEDADLALLGALFRAAEGAIGAAGLPITLALLGAVTATGAGAADPVATQAIAAILFKGSSFVGATFFAVGSTIFSWLLLRGRLIPTWLAWLGVIGSAMIAVGLPLETLRVISGPITQFMWLPIAVFEITVAFYFIIKGVKQKA
jgi:hypothetical protein